MWGEKLIRIRISKKYKEYKRIERTKKTASLLLKKNSRSRLKKEPSLKNFYLTKINNKQKVLKYI